MITLNAHIIYLIPNIHFIYMTTLHFQNIKEQIIKDPSKQESSPIKLCINIEERVKAKILKDRIRVREFFRDYDKLRKGYTSYAYVYTNY